MKSINISKIIDCLTIIGGLIWFSTFFPDNWIRDWFYPSSWGPTATMMILPLLGALVLILSIYCKKLWTGLISICFITAFPLTMFFGYLFLGP